MNNMHGLHRPEDEKMITINTPQPTFCDISGCELPVTRQQRLEAVYEAAKAYVEAPEDWVNFDGEHWSAWGVLKYVLGEVK